MKFILEGLRDKLSLELSEKKTSIFSCEGSSEENLTTAVSRQSVDRTSMDLAADAAHKKGWGVDETPSCKLRG